MMRLVRLPLAGAVALLCACSVVGEPLVDHREGSSGGGPITICATPPDCETASRRVLEEAQLREGLAESHACSGTLVCLGTRGGPDAFSDPCPQTWSTNELVERAADGLALGVACARARIVAAGEDAAPRVRLEGVVIEDAELVLESTTPFELVLAGAVFRNARVHLQGPVTLRLEADTQLVHVQLSADAVGIVRPRLELDQLAATDVLAGTSSAPFHGTVSIARTGLTTSQIVADAAYLESSSFEASALDVLELSAADVKLLRTSIAVQNGTLSSADLQRVRVVACDTFALLGSDVRESDFAACGTLLRVYDTEVTSCAVDGPIESDYSSWWESALGVHEPTDLLAWGGVLSAVNYCEHATTARFGGAAVRCSDCDDRALTEPNAACSVPPMPPNASANYCDLLDALQPCPEPWPERARPIAN